MVSKRPICQESSKWRLRSAGLANAAGPMHISSSVPDEFESALDDAAFTTPEGVERPLDYLRSRILARHTHAMLRVTAYLEPGIRAPGLNLWLLEVLAACCLCFDGPWIAVGDWNMEPHELSQAGWFDTVDVRVFSTPTVSCAGGAGAVLDYFVVSEAVAHLVQQVEVEDISPTEPTLASQTLTQSFVLGSQGLGTTRSLSRRRCLWDHEDRRSASIRPARLERSPTTWSLLGWSGCAQPRLLGAASTTHAELNAGLVLGRSKWLVIEHVSLAQASRKDTRKGCSKKAAAWRALRRSVAQAVSKFAVWRKGRNREHTPQRSVHAVASVALPHLGPWEPGWEFPSMAALADTLHKAVASENWTDVVRQVMLFIECHTQLPVHFSGAESADSGRRKLAWSPAGQVHAFTQIGIDSGEQCTLAGPELLASKWATVVGRAWGGGEAARRPGRLGRSFAKTLTRRG